ncbi:hypothetical protein FTX61_18515 [Nitriliruptoraceae bacterium ZYF776]|nr:hypothetical protein [Profundirhabdus halotolerans]
MDPWPRFDHRVRTRYGVGDLALAAGSGVARARYFDRTSREGWARRRGGVRLHPEVPRSVQQDLLVACLATRTTAAAAGDAALWLRGVLTRPPRRPHVVVAHAATPPDVSGVLVRRARWLRPDDVEVVGGIPTLRLPAALLSLGRVAPDLRRRRLIDALHRGDVTCEAILARVADLGPVPGRAALVAQCLDLAGRHLESTFNDEVIAELDRLGYRPDREPRVIATPDGIGLTPDAALADWMVAVEPEGDAFHRTREDRRRDRRRQAAYAGTPWVPVPVDWRDWHLERDRVLDRIDDAIRAQRSRGIGAEVPLPPR